MQYYVHYVDYNKRLDEWVTEDRLDTRKIEPPQGKEEKEKHATGATTGVNTPKKAVTNSVAAASSSSVTSSRPASPAPGTAGETPATPATPDITGP